MPDDMAYLKPSATTGTVGYAILGIFQHGHIKESLQSGLVEAAEPIEFQDLTILAAVDVKMLPRNDPVQRRRPGFVGTKNVHRAEVLDGVEPLHDGLSPATAPPALLDAASMSYKRGTDMESLRTPAPPALPSSLFVEASHFPRGV